MIHNNYEKLTYEERRITDEMFAEAYKYAMTRGLKLSGDDRAEKLVEAIATYIVESKKN